MKNFRKYKWFWNSLLAWSLLGAVGAEAFIFSPLPLTGRKISEFTYQMNGAFIKNWFSETLLSSTGTLDSLTREWAQSGWKCLSPNFNLAPLLLEASNPGNSPLSSVIQMRLFQKGGAFRILGILNDGQIQKSYQWISEIPADAFLKPEAAADHFLFKPPAGAFQLAEFRYSKSELFSWSSYPVPNPEESFRAWFSSQGFSVRPLTPKIDSKSLFLLQRENAQYLAVIRKESKVNYFSLVKLQKI